MSKGAMLGLGCAGLTTAGSRRDALRLLECAFDCGIRHYDVARLYGFGMAEQLLGEFIRGRRAEVTVTTKFGLQPPNYARNLRFFVSAAKRILKKIPALDRRVRRSIANATTSGRFSVPEAKSSLETSLREMRTDYIDILLLHEAGLPDAENPELLEFLSAQKRAGKIRKCGLGSEFALLQGDCGLFPPQYEVFQFENGVLRNNRKQLLNRDARTLITHSAHKDSAAAAEILKSRTDAVNRFRSDTGLDPMDASTRHALMLAWAAHENPGSLVLFGSNRQQHIRANAAALNDPRFSREATERFCVLLRGSTDDRQDRIAPA